ncbi:MAG: potassium channel family protein [Clostridiales bacterium]|nr:potassium channel family protein [Clostridiales bacterium]
MLHILDFAGLVSVAKASRILRITRLFRLTRLVTLLGRLFKKSRSFLNTNGFKYLLYFSLLFIITGGGLLAYFEDMSVLDGVWCAFVTLATVGYGDIAPSTNGGRAIAVILMLFGIGLIGSLTSTITSYYLHSKKNEVVSNDRVDMVEKMYNELNDAEKELFREKIKEDAKDCP